MVRVRHASSVILARATCAEGLPRGNIKKKKKAISFSSYIKREEKEMCEGTFDPVIYYELNLRILTSL